MYPVQEQLQVLLHHNPRVKHEDFSWMYSYIGSNAFKMTTLGSGGYHGITQWVWNIFVSKKIIPWLKGSHTPKTTWFSTVMEHVM